VVKQRIWTALAWVLVIVLGISCQSKLREEEPTVEITSLRPLTAKQAYPIAKARVQEWQTNAYLGDVTMVIPGNEVEGGPHRIVFYFVADHAFGPFSWWDSVFITVDAYEGKVIEFDEYKGATSLQGKPGRFYIESTVLDSTDALRMAEDLGGKAYREKYPNAQVRISGTHGLIQGEMFWDVGYFRPPEVLGDELGFGIEARTGEVRGDAYLPPSFPQ
jgi:hypothetical protein